MGYIGKDIKILLNTGNEILQLKRQLQTALRTEDYDQAIDLRNAIAKHESQRDKFDMMYETSRFVASIEMEQPSKRL